jgi:hypothetical protein
MQCLPDNLKDRVYYHPTNQGIEARIAARLEEIKRARVPGTSKRSAHHGEHREHGEKQLQRCRSAMCATNAE